jgi:FxsC-like protein
MGDYEFFFSYARVDHDAYLERFYNDLATEVRRLVPLSRRTPTSEIGFFDDGSIDVGEIWDAALVDGLQTARTFVAALTPGYVNSANCGRELAVFLQRVAGGGGTARTRQALLLPIMWQRPSRVRVPEVLDSYQRTHQDLGATYAERGLRYLARRSASDPEYNELVDELAARVVQARSTAVPALAPPPRWDTIHSAFAADPGSTAAAEADDPLPNVPKAWFAFMAGCRTELAALRADVTGYGGEAIGWRPFAPSEPDMVGVTAQLTVGKEGLVFRTLEIDGTLTEQMRRAEQSGEIVVVVVDPWTARLASYRAYLRSIDQAQFVNYGVLVPLNPHDSDSVEQADALRGQVREALSRTYVVNPSYIRDSISTKEEFERELVAAVADARRRLAQLRDVNVWNGATPRPMPVVAGPAGAR